MSALMGIFSSPSPTSPRLVGLLGLLMLATSCVTSGQGEAMKRDIARLTERIEEMEKRGTEAEEQMVRLRQILDEATVLLARNNADVGARVQKAEMDIGALQGRLEEAKHLLEQIQKQQSDESARLATLEQGQQKIVDRVAPAMAEDKETLWKQAQERMAGGLREDARRFFRGFIQRFPQDPRASQAYVEIGRSFALEGKHTQAAAEYQKVLNDFPKAPEVPEAMWLLGQAFVDLKFCTDARALLQDLTKRYPKSPRAADAKNRIRDLQKMVRNKSVCTS
jgi:TolA-binding protein